MPQLPCTSIRITLLLEFLVISQRYRGINSCCAASPSPSLSFPSPPHRVTSGSASTEAQTKSLPEGGGDDDDKSGDDDNDLWIQLIPQLPNEFTLARNMMP